MRMRNSLFARVLGGSLIFWASSTVQEYHQIIVVKVPLAGEKVKVLVSQSCLTLRNLVDCISPGFSVHGIHQAGILDCHDLL